MTTDEALQFLSNHQPMPSDNDLTEELINQYDIVRRYFISYPDDRAISLFLRSYGEGDGWGVYQLVEDFFYKCRIEKVKQEIKNVLEDITVPKSVRYWVTQVSVAFCDNSMIKGLKISLNYDDVDIRDAAESALDILGYNTKNK
ncbi:TPA: hypothetical protein ACKRFJ_001747 [Proteus mirabilis]|nr:hypothetical protein [Proteus mirabilis]